MKDIDPLKFAQICFRTSRLSPQSMSYSFITRIQQIKYCMFHLFKFSRTTLKKGERVLKHDFSAMSLTPVQHNPWSPSIKTLFIFPERKRENLSKVEVEKINSESFNARTTSLETELAAHVTILSL